jgi:hypothetical protein
LDRLILERAPDRTLPAFKKWKVRCLICWFPIFDLEINFGAFQL